MKCPNCGGEADEKDRFCEKCGISLRLNVEAKWKIIAVVLVLGAVLLGFWMIAPGFTKSPKSLDSTPTPTAMATATVYPTPTITSIPDTKSFTNSIGMEFVLIPAGEFDMGTENKKNRLSWEAAIEPVHRVKIGEAFYMGKYEVTQKQWREVNGTTPSWFTGDDLPVESVSWDDVQQFITKLNAKEGTTKYRLPSEAEWEYAARAGTTTRYSFGDDESKLGDYAWYYDNSNNNTHPVGQKKPNAWGLYDMHGNVWEWVQDKWHDNYYGAPTDGSAWESGSGALRVSRCCGWGSKNVLGFRSAARTYADPGYRRGDQGFRLLRDL